MYDDKMNSHVLAIMTWAPLLMLSFGYWMLSSNQLISNDHLTFFNQTSSIITTEHVWTHVFKSEGYVDQPGMPLLVMFWVLFVGVFARNSLYKLVTKLIPSL